MAGFIVSGMRRLGIVDNLEFKLLLHKLDHPRYVFPCRRHFAGKIIPEMYDKKKREIGEKLQMTQSVALTTDSWTSRACHSYITVTEHFVADDWTINMYCKTNGNIVIHIVSHCKCMSREMYR